MRKTKQGSNPQAELFLLASALVVIVASEGTLNKVTTILIYLS
jgi:hypothetical protein